ncbi:MAG: VLRF1 family aeRF1-type release factor [Ignavibacterium sp.]|jgi:hypothetical protein|uniref:VLRF1 family aeRF1-type release factor n=1 Tax=Ignavibacterium album TaxID=591197 RepID=UPI0026F375C7|nr:VLRF1 family aeRF1-type release factor [Ignavibacterium album]MCA2004679.1 VLRF1 family aeRF1-type release factor [Ignavibacterium sp.]MCX8106606.1 VLRF1 family aeRF1-type release factor [Ignavibacterium album]
MISKKDIQFIKEQIEFHKEPVLSVYADVNPAKPENARQGWKIRIKNSLKENNIPDYIKSKVLEVLEIEKPSAKTVAIFAADDFIERYDLNIELPVVDVVNGKIDLTWGKPNITPLVYAIDEYERTGILYLKKKGWQFYEFFLGELRELEETFKEIKKSEWDDLESSVEEITKDFFKERVPTHPDKFPKRVNSYIIRFYKHLAGLVEKIISSNDIKRLILLGPDEQTKFFSQYLSKSTRNIIAAFAGDLPVHEASPARISEKVNNLLEKIERENELKLVNNISNSDFVSGVENTLEALQMGRVYDLIVPWSLNVKVFRCDDGYLSSSEEKVKSLCGNNKIETIELKNIIIDLAINHGGRIEFVRGEAEEKLMKDFGGLAGLLRW